MAETKDLIMKYNLTLDASSKTCIENRFPPVLLYYLTKKHWPSYTLPAKRESVLVIL